MAQPTTIAQGTRIAGNIEASEDVAVEGHVEGRITLSEVLTIAATGVVHGDVEAREAVVEGVLVGTVRASGRVYLGANARVEANITTPLLVMADGARVAGQLNVGVDDELAAYTGEAGAAAPARATAQPATTAAATAARSTSYATTAPASTPARPAYTPPTSYTRPAPTPTPAYTRPEPAARPAAAAPATAFEPGGATTTTVTTVEEPAEEPPEPLEVSAVSEAPAQAEPAPVQEPQPDGEASNGVDSERFEELDEDYTVKELREELRRRDLPVTGTKAELIERLLQAEGSR